MKGLYQQLTDILLNIIKSDYDVNLDLPLWEAPSKKEFGDLSSSAAMKLASKLKIDPLEIATKLKKSLEDSLGQQLERIEILKPAFINIFVSKESLADSLNSLVEEGQDFFKKKIKRKVLLEFCSANPTGPLSIAHGRQAVVGDVIGRILQFYGNSVTREYYLNDCGRQIELLVRSVKERVKEIKGEVFDIPEGGYLGEYIKNSAQDFIDANPKSEKKFILNSLLSLIKKDLKDLGIEFNKWISQEKIIKDGKVEEVVEILREKDLIRKEDDADWFISTRFGDDKDRVIKKADGELTYFASDIAYHKEKINRGYDYLLNLWGPDHHGYIPRVKAAIMALDFDVDILKILIIQLVTLKTKEKMSKRKGTAILLADLIENVGKDAARFYYLTRKNSSHLEFDVDLAKQVSFDNPLYYVQYSCARIESIFKKAAAKKGKPEHSLKLNTQQEVLLLRTLLQFSFVLDKAYYCLEPVFIIEYLKDLAAVFHRFYETSRVVGEVHEVASARLNLLYATREVLHAGLNVLGIAPVEKM